MRTPLDPVALRKTKQYRALCRQVKRERPPVCWLCRKAIDITLPYRDPHTRRVNGLSWSLDHVLPLDTHPELGLDPRNAQPAHFSCNASRGSRPPRRPSIVAPLKTSRSW